MPTGLSVWRLGEQVRDRIFRVAARRSFRAWGRKTLVRLPFRVEGESRISLGENVFVGEGSWFQTIGDGEITVCDGCRFSGYAVISAAAAVVIGRDVLIARNVHILDHLHRFDIEDTPVHSQGIRPPKPVRVGENAWIGANVVILPGVTIGRGAVVAANSVVRRDVSAFTVVAGAPATFIRGVAERQPRLHARSSAQSLRGEVHLG
jgi:lipopolysaccharide O-acetyltransferase